jgi:hypothetical protein
LIITLLENADSLLIDGQLDAAVRLNQCTILAVRLLLKHQEKLKE